ncbi:hypothetical protein [Bartonella sp. ML70XJBT.G]|nr:hypothetical protein [Bartonella sp. ML70XJBT.G]
MEKTKNEKSEQNRIIVKIRKAAEAVKIKSASNSNSSSANEAILLR